MSRWSVLLLLCCAPAASWALSSSEQSADDPKAWLEKMVEATQNLNYVGVFVYRDGDRMETMRIVHRTDGDGERERLVSLSGSVREVLRDEERVTCILPDRQSVVVGKSRSRSLLPMRALRTADGLTRHYMLSVREGGRVAGRDTRLVNITPRDEYRYAYRFWVDADNGLLLKSEVHGDATEPLEEIVYTSIETPQRIADAMLEPSVSGQGFTWYTTEKAAAPQSAGEKRWRITWVPPGFALRQRDRDPVPTSSMPVDHRWYTDGVASLSVFIEPLPQDGEPLEGASSMGAVNAFGRVVDGHQVTVVGEVPARTVQSVGQSVVPE
ncbi:MAG: hypothetical protein GWN84_24225 [Gammaproteobacteria bacterium]|nr:hypothetical protein [Gammaproteobacteria bacterium]NIR85691.1 hypothetical protein [Gammaproteobacteria bacterium]NIR90224.1 hypothetical protein [Gammaproteobacteria bacterium]NIU06825.1 hypothetical protein [Gammaproteobacteria bacterium]NIV53758.1 hypothetical protein [Gammaproteobacteria bacterium]